MCRLLAVVADRVAPIPELVPDELARLEALSGVHSHGWGVAHVDAAGAVATDREPTRASESDAWRTALGAIRTDSATLHIRQASDGMPLVTENTHPFLADGAAFSHNGWAWPNERLDALVVGAREAAAARSTAGLEDLEGVTDSERYFALARAHGIATDPAAAVLRAADAISSDATATSLNALLLTPDALVAVAWWHATVIRGQPEGETERDYRLWYRVTPDRVVVASAGVADEAGGDWQEVPRGHALVVRRADLATHLVDPAGVSTVIR